MKYNPFRPNGLISPGIFHGRMDEIRAVEHGLFQAKNGNPVHFIIQGERGIGKSSLFYVLSITADGQIETLSGDKLNFLVVSVDLGGSHSQLDIIRAVARELKTVIAERSGLKEKAKSFWEWASNWEILGVRYHKDQTSFDPQDAADELVGQIAKLCAQLKDNIDGMLLLIDEADRPDEDANLGEFCKHLTERLARKSCFNVVLGLAGLPTLLGKLRQSHESSVRIFTTLLLSPLLPEECKQVIRSGLKDADAKNQRKTSITGEALELLSSLSEGYPHFIQQFSYSAFEADSDDKINVADVMHGAFGENGALSQLGDKYFSSMYHSKIASDDYRVILHTMATHADNWISRKDIIQQSGLPGTTVTNALNALKAREIILSDESRKGRGFYRLPTRSFAAWINAVKSLQERSRQSGDRQTIPDLF
jgi:hypothetical protein